MEWQFRNDSPIYTQLTQRLTQAIVAGEFRPGERLPSVRELAVEAGVNPNTVQRALADLERDGLVFSQRTAGRFVTGDVSMIENAKLRLADQAVRPAQLVQQLEQVLDQCVENFLSEMAKLGCGRDEVIALLQGRKEEEP